MKAFFSPLLFLLGASAGALGSNVRRDPGCETTSTLPTMTLSQCPGSGSYVQTYTVTYTELCPTGVQPHIYTVTETCDKAPCYNAAAATGPPPAFTAVEMACSACDNGAPLTQTVTLPVASIEPSKSQGYSVVNTGPTNAPDGTQDDNGSADSSPSPAGVIPVIPSGSPTGTPSDPSTVPESGVGELLVNAALLGALGLAALAL